MFFEHWQMIKALKGSVQLVGLQVLIKFDEARFPERLLISDRELMRLSGLRSLRTIQVARAKLQEAGFCVCVSKAGHPTEYRLGSHQSSQLVVTTQAAQSGVAADIFSSENDGGSREVVTQVVTCEKNTINARAHTLNPREREKNSNVDDLTFEWEAIHPNLPLDGTCREKLTVLVGKYSAAQIKTAIAKSAKALSPYLLSKFSYMESCLEGTVYGQSKDDGVCAQEEGRAREGTGANSEVRGLRPRDAPRVCGTYMASGAGEQGMPALQRLDLSACEQQVSPGASGSERGIALDTVHGRTGNAAAVLAERESHSAQVRQHGMVSVHYDRAERSGSKNSEVVRGDECGRKSVPIGHDGQRQNFSGKSHRAGNVGTGKESVFRGYAECVEQRTRKLLERLAAVDNGQAQEGGLSHS